MCMPDTRLQCSCGTEDSGSQLCSDQSLSPAGARMHASQSAQRLDSSGDTSTSGRPSVDSESSSLALGRQQQPVHPGMNAR